MTVRDEKGGDSLGYTGCSVYLPWQLVAVMFAEQTRAADRAHPTLSSLDYRGRGKKRRKRAQSRIQTYLFVSKSSVIARVKGEGVEVGCSNSPVVHLV